MDVADDHVTRVLTVNAGSTSLKLERYELDPQHLASIADPPDPVYRAEPSADDANDGLREALGGGVDRVVHRFVQLPNDAPAIFALDAPMLARIREVAKDDPLHDAAALRGVEAISSLAPQVSQFGVSDSAFHQTMSAAVTTYPLPRDLIARYPRKGYHGLSHEYAAHRACALAGRDVTRSRLVIAHLGGGSSLCAVRDGAGIDTTMGWSSLEGVPMATRSGSIDPGILIHLGRSGFSFDDLAELLERKSGLAGISARSGDLRELIATAGPDVAAPDADARLALDVLTWRVRSAFGAMIASLGGVDVLAFTGGIGQHAATIRAAVLANGLGQGVVLDDILNTASREGRIAGECSPVAVVVVTAREGWLMARICATV